MDGRHEGAVLLPMRIHMHCRSADLTGRRYLAVKPILFMSQRAPGSFHSFVPPIGWLIGRALRELRATLGVFAEDFRLLHAILQEGNFGFVLTLNQMPSSGPHRPVENISCMHR